MSLTNTQKRYIHVYSNSVKLLLVLSIYSAMIEFVLPIVSIGWYFVWKPTLVVSYDVCTSISLMLTLFCLHSIHGFFHIRYAPIAIGNCCIVLMIFVLSV